MELEEEDDMDTGVFGLLEGNGSPTAHITPTEAWLDFDALELTHPMTAGGRGCLVHRVRPAAPFPGALHFDALPEGLCDPQICRGSYDHRYDSDGTCEVASNGATHRVSVTSAKATSRPVLRTVPREQSEVFREVMMVNPFDSPLLTGPVDVFIDGALLRTSVLKSVDRGGQLWLGLGPEDRVRVARNVRMEETTHGLLGGTTRVQHDVDIELASALGMPMEVVVIDRIPVTDDKEVEVKLTSASPEPKEFDQVNRGHPIRGGLSWTVEIPPGGTANIRFGYSVELGTKLELVGGNRRE